MIKNKVKLIMSDIPKINSKYININNPQCYVFITRYTPENQTVHFMDQDYSPFKMHLYKFDNQFVIESVWESDFSSISQQQEELNKLISNENKLMRIITPGGSPIKFEKNVRIRLIKPL